MPVCDGIESRSVFFAHDVFSTARNRSPFTLLTREGLPSLPHQVLMENGLFSARMLDVARPWSSVAPAAMYSWLRLYHYIGFMQVTVAYLVRPK